MYLSTMQEWLNWIGSVHNKEIDLGLDRIRLVADRLGLLRPTCTVITVAGTNGKGSTVAGLEAIYLASGYRTGCFTSPILFKHNEEVRINGIEASDDDFICAFGKINEARDSISLSPFEFHTLAALLIFASTKLDVMILEVGLGGRLDAVNVMDADLAIITSIGIDHTEWLGETREAIAVEKAGILRPNGKAVCGDSHPPSTLLAAAKNCQAQLFIQGRDFSFTQHANEWSWQSGDMVFSQLPQPLLAIHNFSTVLMSITLLQAVLPVSNDAIRAGIAKATLPGRLQVTPGEVTEIIDVGHNCQALEWLKLFLEAKPFSGKTIAVFSMLGDKDIAGSVAIIKSCIDHWYVAPLGVKRAASREVLQDALAKNNVAAVTFCHSIPEAYALARAHASSGDRLVIFGSFHTVASIYS